MFEMSFIEMATIGIVALVVIGPERLPEVAKKVGHYVGKVQRLVRGVRSDISRELEAGDLKALIGDQKNQIDELRSMVKTATQDIQSSTGNAYKDAQDALKGSDTTSENTSGTSSLPKTGMPKVNHESDNVNDSKSSSENDKAS